MPTEDPKVAAERPDMMVSAAFSAIDSWLR